ncbi:MAG: sulfur oxidation c-type cytochrome SoxA [Burkholderiaceae bacterium]
MKPWVLFLCMGLVPLASAAQPRTSGNGFLSPQLLALQNDANKNPIALWNDRGQGLWQTQCQSCHGAIEKLKTSATTFPRLTADSKTLHNLEDQIARCQQRSASAAGTPIAPNDNDDVLALSAALHQAAKGEPINVAAAPAQEAAWQARLASGQQLYQTRMGRINLACMHCHDQKVGAQMRADTISQGHPTGFPIYRMSWQTIGSTERRLRACYSGVQAPLPAPGSTELRDLELFMKVRANGMALDGPSIRR